MFLFLDDVRNVEHVYPNSKETWVTIRKATEAMKLISTGKVEFISFDHDLGTDLTGYDVATFTEELVILGKIKCPDFAVHSSNFPGRKRIWATMRNAMNYEPE
jgi:hypothetical protein